MEIIITEAVDVESHLRVCFSVSRDLFWATQIYLSSPHSPRSRAAPLKTRVSCWSLSCQSFSFQIFSEKTKSSVRRPWWDWCLTVTSRAYVSALRLVGATVAYFKGISTPFVYRKWDVFGLLQNQKWTPAGCRRTTNSSNKGRGNSATEMGNSRNFLLMQRFTLQGLCEAAFASECQNNPRKHFSHSSPVM